MNDEKIILFAGTEEGRRLFEYLYSHGIPVEISVATEYGKSLIQEGTEQVKVHRLTSSEMQSLFLKQGYTLVVDATHPYAVEVSQNIKEACQKSNLPYLRIVRKDFAYDNTIDCNSLKEAVLFLSSTTGNILSTVGSKELAELTKIPDFFSRVYVRMLPIPQAIEQALSLGFAAKNLICMQGPFSEEMNAAMLKQLHCRYLLTKNSGDIGGFDCKLAAAQKSGVTTVVIKRPTEENGITYHQAIKYFTEKYGISKETRKKSHFPAFLDVTGKTVLVVGAGTIAERRIRTLLQFDCMIKVVAPDVSEEISELAEEGKIDLQCRQFENNDVKDVFFVVAATNVRDVNHQVAEKAKQQGILASIADCKEECSFYFPAIVTKKSTIIGIAGDGGHHKEVSNTAKQIREWLADETESR